MGSKNQKIAQFYFDLPDTVTCEGCKKHPFEFIEEEEPQILRNFLRHLLI